MKFIVTGGSGYIGSHMCKLLRSMDHEVCIIDEIKPKHKYYSDYFQFNIGHSSIIGGFLSFIKPDGVFHFAAHSIVPESEQNPMKYYLNNVNESISFINEVVKANVQHFIFSSTAAVYGTQTSENMFQTHFREDDRKNPINSYGKTKSIIEDVLLDLSSKGKLKTTILRYFNVAGCCPESTIGEDHDPETHIIPKIIKEILNGKDEVFIYGNKYETIDGTNVRDYVHVEDLVEAHWKAFMLMTNTSSASNLIMNIGSQKGFTNLEVISTILKVMKSNCKITIAPPRHGDPDSLVAITSLAKNLINYEPEFDLEDMIRHTYNYLKERK